VRDEATAALCTMNRPQRKDEAWRRTDLSLLFGASLTTPSPVIDSDVLSNVLDDGNEGGNEGLARVVIVNGNFSPDLSDLRGLPTGMFAGSLSDFEGDATRDALLQAVRQMPETDADPRTALGCCQFGALNQGCLSDVTLVYVPADTIASVRLVILSSCSADDALAAQAATSGATAQQRPTSFAISHPNVLVRLEPSARLNLLQQYSGCGSYFSNGLTRLEIGEDALLEHTYLQEQGSQAVHIDALLASCDARSSYQLQAVQTGARISRLNLGVSLQDVQASATVNGLMLASGNQLLDLHSSVLHSSGACSSSQMQRNALAGRARVVFKGAVQVPFGSDNTKADQLCRSLLLSDSARVDVQPTLEIFTDEVECTHGATITDLDDEMVFYLQSRGLDRKQARTLLLQGWVNDCLSQVPLARAKQRVVMKAGALALESERRVVRRSDLSSI